MARDQQAFVPRLRALGFSGDGAAVKAQMLAACDRALDRHGAAQAGRVSAWVPGRIEVFGKHTDYAGGRSLLTAVTNGFCVRAAPRTDRMLRVLGAPVPDPLHPGGRAPELHCEMPLDETAGAPDGDWSNYVATVVRRVTRNFPAAVHGVDIAFASDLPPAAGASSSSALMIGTFLAIAAINRLPRTDTWRQVLPDRVALGGYLGAMEHGGSFGPLLGDAGVGTLGGCQDQTAILCAEPGHVVDFGWMPVRRLGSYALPADKCFVIAASGVVAEKSAGARAQYNRASLMVRHLLARWNDETGRDDHSLAVAAESGPGAIEVLRDVARTHATEAFSADVLRMRLDQFLLETYTLIPAAAAAFAAQDWPALGAVTARSQEAAEEWLGNQVPETIALVRMARASGATAASAFGAGFGGSVWALVDAGQASFEARWASAYRQQFPVAGARAMFFRTAAGPAATTWADDDPLT
ncbi:MAG: hypothetical protein IT355_01855 [Gemmatimonadaceae bacterium]|nr:hypothetical protein [Gemmatimonadaceae bacterium]